VCVRSRTSFSINSSESAFYLMRPRETKAEHQCFGTSFNCYVIICLLDRKRKLPTPICSTTDMRPGLFLLLLVRMTKVCCISAVTCDYDLAMRLAEALLSEGNAALPPGVAPPIQPPQVSSAAPAYEHVSLRAIGKWKVLWWLLYNTSRIGGRAYDAQVAEYILSLLADEEKTTADSLMNALQPYFGTCIIFHGFFKIR